MKPWNERCAKHKRYQGKSWPKCVDCQRWFLRKEIHRMDSKSEGDEFDAAVFTMASGVVGTNLRKLRRLTRIPKATAQIYATNLRRSKVWKGRGVYADWDGPEGRVSFWMDVCVALGLLERK